MIAWAAGSAQASLSQTLPSTQGESLSGRPIVLAEAVRNHPALIIAGFSRAAGPACGDCDKAVRADSRLAGRAVYQMAMLEQAPSLLRGVIKSPMRKHLSTDQQDHFVVLTQDEKLWRSYFGVTSDQDSWIVLIDASGQVLWHGLGAASNLGPLLKAALRH